MNLPRPVLDRFWKMHAAGNDFVLWVDPHEAFPFDDRDRLMQIARRPEGIGCDGHVILQPSDRADFRMRFVNPDGREAPLCGNGLRCAARLAYDLGWAGRVMTVETPVGILRAQVQSNGVGVDMPPPRDLRLHEHLEVEERHWEYAYLNTGVPHLVTAVEDLDPVDVDRWGRAIRFHPRFAPDGTNVNFFAVREGAVHVRTYERGVEAETGACGTGAVAVAVVAALLGRIASPVTVVPRSGIPLRVSFQLTPEGAEDVWLFGPATYVFEGRWVVDPSIAETPTVRGGTP